MKNKLMKYGFLLWAAIAVMATTFTACEKEEDGAVSLDSFGPTPVLRGETIRFIGSNLDRVTAVVFPENIEVTPVKVSSGEITAVIPAEAVNGYITLRYPGGTLITKSHITYADAVTFASVTGETDPVRAGDVITLTGDNLTGVTEVVFSTDVAVASRDFLTQSRYEITLVLPNNAQTGEVYLLAGAIETSRLTLNVDGPSITAITAAALKPGRDTLLIEGTNLDLAVSVIFSGDVTVDAVQVDATRIKAAVPADALNGTIKVVSTAGVEYESTGEVTLVAPAGLAHTAAAGYKAGHEIILTGTDLDLVTGVTFAGEAEVDFSYDETTGHITVTIPATATDGAMTLHCVAGDVETPDVTLVEPVITAIVPATIQAGDEITITGTDLDLVTGVTVGGKPCTITGQNVTTINATTPMDASIAGSDVEVALVLANGVSVTDAINVTFPVFCFVLEFKNDIKAGELLTATVTNSDKLTGVEIDNEAVQYILQGSTLYVSVPGNASGAAELKLISSDGNASYTINIIGTGPVETVISTDVVDLGSWANTLLIPATNVAVRPGTRVKIYYTSTAANPQFKIMTGNWAAQTIDDPNYDAQWSVVGVSETGSISSSWSFVLDETILAAFASDGGMLIGGQNIIISKVSVVSGGTSEVLWEGSTATGSWSGNVTLNASAFASAAAGNRIIVTCADVEGGAQWGIRDGNWSNIVEYADIFGYRYEYTIDAAGLAALQATGGIFTGHDYTIIKIELKNY